MTEFEICNDASLPYFWKSLLDMIISKPNAWVCFELGEDFVLGFWNEIQIVNSKSYQVKWVLLYYYIGKFIETRKMMKDGV